MTRRARALAWLRDRWNGQPGRHDWRYLDTDIRPDRRPIFPRLPRLTEAELAEAEAELAGNLAEALQRSKYPHRYWPNDDYWRQQWQEHYAWCAEQTADRFGYRQREGLEPETLLDFVPAVAA